MRGFSKGFWFGESRERPGTVSKGRPIRFERCLQPSVLVEGSEVRECATGLSRAFGWSCSRCGKEYDGRGGGR